MITITDTITSATATVETYEVAETIAAWYPEAPAETIAAIADLETALLRGTPTDDLEAFLSVSVS